MKRAGKFIGHYTPERSDTPRRWDGERGWDGLWDTTFGRLRLLHEADRVRGFYQAAGPACLHGQADGARLSFRYQEKSAAGEGCFEVAENDYAFGDMLRAVFARLAKLRVRHRIFHDADSPGALVP